MKKTSLRAGVAILATAATLLGGCGSKKDDKPSASASAASPAPADNGVAALTADAILAKAIAALKKAGSFHMTGTMKNEGGEMVLDMKVSGQNLAGSMTKSADSKIELLAVDGKQFMKPSEAFWAEFGLGEQAADLAAAVGTKWVEVPTSDQNLSGIFGMSNVDELMKPSGTVTKGEVTKVGTSPVITLTDSKATGDSKMFVATTGEPYPVQIGPATGSGVTFSEFGATFDTFKAPAAGETVNLADIAPQEESATDEGAGQEEGTGEEGQEE
jgi:hypothetical protein